MPTSADPTRVVVADDGPLIALGRLGELRLLPELLDDVQVTETVIDECLARPDLPDAQSIASALGCGWLTPCPDVAYRALGGSIRASRAQLHERSRSVPVCSMAWRPSLSPVGLG